MSNKNRLFDVRTVERNIEKGLVTQEEYDAHVASLDDAEDNATVIEAEFKEGVLEPSEAQADEAGADDEDADED